MAQKVIGTHSENLNLTPGTKKYEAVLTCISVRILHNNCNTTDALSYCLLKASDPTILFIYLKHIAMKCEAQVFEIRCDLL